MASPSVGTPMTIPTAAVASEHARLRATKGRRKPWRQTVIQVLTGCYRNVSIKKSDRDHKQEGFDALMSRQVSLRGHAAAWGYLIGCYSGMYGDYGANTRRRHAVILWWI